MTNAHSKILGLLLPLAALGACARSEPANQSPIEEAEPANEIAAVDIGDDETTVTPGSWVIDRSGEQPVAFRSASGEVLFSLRCDERRGLVVRRPGLVPRSQLALLQLRIGGEVRRLAVTASAAGTPQIESVIPYNDELIGPLMSFSDPLEVRFTGLDTLTLPPSPEVAAFVRECQTVASGSDGAPATNATAPVEPAGNNSAG